MIFLDTVYTPQVDKVGRVPLLLIELIKNRLTARYPIAETFPYYLINDMISENPGKRLGTIFKPYAQKRDQFKAHLCSLVNISQLKEGTRLIVPSNPFVSFYQVQGLHVPETKALEWFMERVKPHTIDKNSKIIFRTDIDKMSATYPENYVWFDPDTFAPIRINQEATDDMFIKHCLIEWLKWSEPA